MAHESKSAFRLEYRLRRADGSHHWVIDSATPRFGLRGELIGYIGSVIDITDRKRVEEERERVVRELADAVRTRDEFLSVASHELKTPITPLSLKLQGLAAATRDGLVSPRLLERIPKDVDAMLRQVMRLTDLVEALLDVSRIGNGQLTLAPEPVELTALVSDVASRFELQAERARSKLILKCTGPIEGAWDKLRVEQVVSNLLSNAIKYGRGQPIEVSTETSDTLARLIVRDLGIGIAKEALGRIFGKFERAVSERNYGGLGLGLYVTKQILDAMGGSISVDSAPGGGATFIVELPREQPGRIASASGAPEA